MTGDCVRMKYSKKNERILPTLPFLRKNIFLEV
nr:MAG TPA: hypothetical protein [Siphoviridae sp. ctX8T1]